MARVEERLEHLSIQLELIRGDLSASQRQFAEIGWGLSLALIGAVVALIISVA
jgi:hypothetical protein